jgi:sulfur-oxidizing protein SoxX
MRKLKVVLLLAPALVAAGCTALQPDREAIRKAGEDAVAHAYPGMPDALTARAIQDTSQKICSNAAREKLSADEAMTIVQAARASMKYPASGKLMGDWKVGAKLVVDGGGMRVRDGQVEKLRENGALCTNCHVMDPKEVNSGNLGPSLTGYGRSRGTSEAVVRQTYEKIYNAWLYLPCSNMPRLGSSGYLTPEQITHLVAYLVDPQSTVNRP